MTLINTDTLETDDVLVTSPNSGFDFHPAYVVVKSIHSADSVTIKYNGVCYTVDPYYLRYPPKLKRT